MEKVSVIIPCFNSGKTIKKAVNSVKSQTWKNLEIIIINDGSTDAYTIKILNEMKKIKIIHQLNKGLSSARNTGIKNAKGKYILFLDSDDWIKKNAVEEMFKLLKSSNHVFTFCDMILEGKRSGLQKKNFNYFEQLFLNHIPYSILIKKDIFDKIGYYDERMNLGYEDWELNLRLAKKGYYPIKVDIPLFHYNVSTSGMLNSISKQRHSSIFNYIKNKHKETYKIPNILKLYLKWKGENRNYSLFVYLVIYISFLIMPNFIFNQFYNFLYRIKNKFFNRI